LVCVWSTPREKFFYFKPPESHKKGHARGNSQSAKHNDQGYHSCRGLVVPGQVGQVRRSAARQIACWSARVCLAHSTTERSPSAIGTFGDHPSSSRAREMSANVASTSPSCI